MGARIRAYDWASSPLGPISSWPQSLKTAVELMLGSGFASALGYGRQGILLYNDAFRQIIGVRHPQAFGRSSLETFAESRAMIEQRIAHIFDGGTVTLTNQPFPIFEEGELRKGWCSLTYGPVRNERGEVLGAFVSIFDTTAQSNAEASLRKSEERQAFLVRLSDALRPLIEPAEIQAAASRVLGEHLDAIRVHYSETEGEQDSDYYVIRQDYHAPSASSLIGRFRPSHFGASLFNEMRARHSIGVADVAVEPMLTDEERAAYRATDIRALICVPLIKQGRLVAFMSVHQSSPRAWTADDVTLVEETVERTWEAVERARAETALRESETRLRLLVSELNHRVKNTLATVQSIASQSLRGAANPAEFVIHFKGRVQALARAHALLTRSSWEGAEVADVVREQLALDGESEMISCGGPPARLHAQSSLALALVLHELGTNAHKYGALSVPHGRLMVAWTITTQNGESRLHLEWVERHGPPVQVPEKAGLGTAVIEQSLRSVGGRTNLCFDSAGLSCTIELPLSEPVPQKA